MGDINIEGMIFRGIARCSTNEQIETSLPDQIKTMTSWAANHGVTLDRIEKFGGRSATYGKQVDEVLAIIEEKHNGAKFDGLLFDSYSRLARTEADSSRLYAELTDAGLKELRELKNLTSLCLWNTPITDVGLGELKELKTLTLIKLTGAPVTDAGVNDLQKALPRCTILR